ncbi:hypothetical protein VTL71DRAFT_8365 [Oculimacula yallundae]|uniref:Uncharacterized protein n=1 Tax=Oculimacula yallundae TaxID=86028 RepID=A0ABR4CXL1_9HELO
MSRKCGAKQPNLQEAAWYSITVGRGGMLMTGREVEFCKWRYEGTMGPVEDSPKSFHLFLPSNYTKSCVAFSSTGVLVCLGISAWRIFWGQELLYTTFVHAAVFFVFFLEQNSKRNLKRNSSADSRHVGDLFI